MSLSPRLFVVALLLLVVPAGVTALFLSKQVRSLVTAGAQPGGVIGGRLVPGDDSPPGLALSGVDVELLAVAPDHVVRSLARTTADAEGRFLLEAPAIEGHYELRAGGGDWQRSVQPFSFLRGALEGGVTVRLLPAARLELSFARRSGLPVRGGEWLLHGENASGWLPIWSGARISRAGKFTGTTLAIDGLPPLRATVKVDLGGGEIVEVVMNLGVGPNRHVIEL